MDDLLVYFNAVDTDRNGYIDDMELQKTLTNGTWKPFHIGTVRLMIHLFDKSTKGRLSFQEFSDLWHYITTWQKVFSSFDMRKSTFFQLQLRFLIEKRFQLDANEILMSLKHSGFPVDEGLVQVVMNAFIEPGCLVDFDAYIHLCIILQQVTHAFSEFPKDKNGRARLDYASFVTSLFNILGPITRHNQ